MIRKYEMENENKYASDSIALVYSGNISIKSNLRALKGHPRTPLASFFVRQLP